VKFRKDFTWDLIQTAADIVVPFKKLQNNTVEIIEQIPKQISSIQKFKPDMGKISDHHLWKFLSDGKALCNENFASNKEKAVD
jgi:hypothetical protein